MQFKDKQLWADIVQSEYWVEIKSWVFLGVLLNI